MRKCLQITVALLLMSIFTLATSVTTDSVSAQPPYAVDVTDGEFTGDEWDDWCYPGACPTPKGTYIYFRTEGSYIYLMHDIINATYNGTWSSNYFPVEYKWGWTCEVWLHAEGIAGYPKAWLQDGPIDHNESTGSNVSIFYDFAGAAGFGTSPNSATAHVMYEFRIGRAGFYQINIEDIVIKDAADEITRFGGSDPLDPFGVAQYADGTNLAEWTWFYQITAPYPAPVFPNWYVLAAAVVAAGGLGFLIWRRLLKRA